MCQTVNLYAAVDFKIVPKLLCDTTQLMVLLLILEREIAVGLNARFVSYRKLYDLRAFCNQALPQHLLYFFPDPQ